MFWKKKRWHNAVWNDDFEKMEKLLSPRAYSIIKPIDVDCVFPYKYSNGYNALLVAVLRNAINLAQYLISKGADVNYKDGLPLLKASEKNQIDMVSLLIKNGATKSKDSALFMAIKKRHHSITHILERSNASIVIKEMPLKRKFGRNHFFFSREDCELSPLLFMAKYDYHEGIKKLIDSGADVNEVSDAGDSLGWTPLMFAARSGNIESIKLLIDGGAKITAIDAFPYDNTPLKLAKSKRCRDYIIERLTKEDIESIHDNLLKLSNKSGSFGSPGMLQTQIRMLGIIKSDSSIPVLIHLVKENITRFSYYSNDSAPYNALNALNCFKTYQLNSNLVISMLHFCIDNSDYFYVRDNASKILERIGGI